jgi:hypothetical protein
MTIKNKDVMDKLGWDNIFGDIKISKHPTSSLSKTLRKIGIHRNCLTKIKNTCGKLTANIILNDERLNSAPQIRNKVLWSPACGAVWKAVEPLGGGPTRRKLYHRKHASEWDIDTLSPSSFSPSFTVTLRWTSLLHHVFLP